MIAGSFSILEFGKRSFVDWKILHSPCMMVNPIDVKKACITASHYPIGGGDQDRTDGLLIANQTLSQLSYTPTSGEMLNRNLLFGKGQPDCPVKGRKVAQVVEYSCSTVKIMPMCIGIDGDVGLDAGSKRRTQAVV